MSDEKKFSDLPGDLNGSDEVEILEVVGIDEGEAPATGLRSSRRADDPDEVVLAFADDPAEEGAAAAAREAASLSGSATATVSETAAVEGDVLLRLRADYDNLRKRIDRERQEFELRANSELIARLLPILDNFEIALGMDVQSDAERAFREGFVLIYKQLVDDLRRQGLRAVESVGQPFDPQVHDAVATEESADTPPNTVTEELRRGYLFQEQLLRPAMVKVSTNGRGDEDAGEDD
jgi:molecular chaperone GrpE